MKTKISTFLALFFVMFVSAQQAINYKAIVKDNLGNVLANQPVTVHFAILQGAGATMVYQETHTVNTNANGLVILSIGAGTILNGDYNTIDWGSDDHFLNVQIDSGSGLIDLGTTQFMAVPYALYAETSGSGSTATGLEALDEGNGVGWRLLGRDPANYSNLGQEAVDLSYSSVASDLNGASGIGAFALGSHTIASGDLSFAMGQQSVASGLRSMAMGLNTEATGNSSVAMGNSTLASGSRSLAMGSSTTASGAFSTSMGSETRAESSYSVAIGKRNIGGGDPVAWIGTDPIFEIGNSPSNDTYSNALTVLKNGTITAPSFDIGEITDPKALVTKEYLDANGGNATGLGALDEGNGTGWRLIGRNPNNYGSIGNGAVDLSKSNTASSIFGATGENSVAIGNLTTASGFNTFASGFNAIASASYATSIGFQTEASQTYALAMGESTVSSGISSVALGAETTASGNGSFSAGDSNTASGNSSVALGFQTNVTHDYSFAMGNNVNVSSFSASALGYNLINDDTYSMVVGRNNDNTTTSSSLFIVGNGSSPTNRSNALTVLQNGKILAPSLDISEITDAKSLVTKEYLEGNYVETGSFETPSGLEAIDDGNGFGWRLIGSSGIYGNIGNHATQLSKTSFVNGSGAVGSYSFTSGIDVTASGNNSTAMGSNTIASGNNSVAIGYFTQSLADFSLTTGHSTIANTDYSTVVGKYNDNSFSSFGGTLFKVGNGTSSTRSNALTVFDTGFVGLGTHFLGPETDLHVFHGNDGSLNGFKLQNKEGSNENWWRFYTLNSNGQLYLYSKAGGNASPVGSFDDASGAYTALSDRRAKANFKDLYFNWQEFMQLQPLTYHYKTDENKKSHIGFVAQDVEPIYPELVNHNKEDDLYQLNYSGFGVVAIKAIQELKKENEQLKALLLKEEQASAEQSQVLQALLERVEALEKQSVSKSKVDLVRN